MPAITVEVATLVAILETNRTAHRVAYTSAVAGFRIAAQARIQQMAHEVERDPLPKHIAFDLPVPEQHLTDYDRAIAMLHLALDKTVLLSEDAYRQYVDDEWGWKESWKLVNSSYWVDKKR